jgi:hypothetical protein
MRIVNCVAGVLVFAGLGMAETWTGIVVDVMCSAKDVPGHTRECATSDLCSSSGYGLAMEDDKFIKFDPAGNVKAKAALKATKKHDNLKTKVTGTLKDGVIVVDTIEIL